MDYKGKRWKKLRAYILKRDGYRCQYESRYGRNRQADTVHHIFPVDVFPEYAYEKWNLISLSRKGHERMHMRETHKLSPTGLHLLRRTATKYNIDYDEGRLL